LQKPLQKAVILVGGEGTRLRPLTNGIPKPMLPVLNHPLLEHTIRYLSKYGITEIILALSYLPDVVKEYFSDGRRLGVQLHYALESSPLGTAGAVKMPKSIWIARLLFSTVIYLPSLILQPCLPSIER